ncbi:hypothetical protein [Microbulbifer sp. SSSA005]|uniref:hypothetical protein n=1 Tax=unclassified Microbulbifer TaxID=2619833 RepID=UPI004039CB71
MYILKLILHKGAKGATLCMDLPAAHIFNNHATETIRYRNQQWTQLLYGPDAPIVLYNAQVDIIGARKLLPPAKDKKCPTSVKIWKISESLAEISRAPDDSS